MPLPPTRPAFTPAAPLTTAADGSHDDDPATARHAFLAGNDLPARWQERERFVVLATGFGPGLEFLATWQAWRADPRRCRRLHYAALEQHPLAIADLVVALRARPEFADLAANLAAAWPPLTPGIHRLHLAENRVILTLVFGKANRQLREVDAAVDAFFVDGELAAGVVDLRSPALCQALARLAAPGATLAATGLAPEACAALAAAEFDLENRPGPTPGDEVLVGRFRSCRPERRPLPAVRRAIVVGAGIAGSTIAHRLAANDWQVTVLEQGCSPGQGASGNLAGMLRPLPSADDNRISRLTRAGYLATRALLGQLPDARWAPCGIVHLAREAEHEAQQRHTVAQLGLPPEMLQFVDREAAGQRLGQAVNIGGCWFPGGGWVDPQALCAAALAAFPEHIALRCHAAVDRINRVESDWQALAADGSVLAAAPVLIMASGVAAPGFAQFAWLPQRAVRGQVTHLPASAATPLASVLFQIGYATPLIIDGTQLIGASLSYDDDEAGERLADHRDNLARLRLSLPDFAAGLDPASLHGRVGFRPMSPDRLPIVGQVPLAGAATGSRLLDLRRQPGLWCAQGYGARGITWAALMADLLVSRLEGAPLPLERDLVDALDPGRFLLRGAGCRKV